MYLSLVFDTAQTKLKVVFIFFSSCQGVCVLCCCCCQIGWEKTDSYVVTAFSPDCIIRVWASSNGRLVQKLEVRYGHYC